MPKPQQNVEEMPYHTWIVYYNTIAQKRDKIYFLACKPALLMFNSSKYHLYGSI